MKHRKLLWESCVLVLCLCAGYILQSGEVSHQPRKADADAVPAGKAAVSFARLPLSFEANQGQTDTRVKFLSRGPGYTLFLTGDEVALELQRPEARNGRFGAMSALQRTKDRRPGATNSVLRLELVNANRNAAATGTSELRGKANYFIGNDPHKWRTNVPTYAKVKYKGIYPGVDLVFYGNQRQLEHDFVVSPGADAGRIAFRLEGSNRVSLDAAGNLIVATEGGEVRFERPLIYQEVNGVRREIGGGFALKSAGEVAFKVGAYDRTMDLVIDPVLAYSTYLGGSGFDWGYGIAVDSRGYAYVTGLTRSSNFPTTAEAFQTSLAGSQNVFVVKLNPTGSALVYSTYLGGSNYDYAVGITVDSSGSAYVTGVAESSNFPTTTGAFQTSLAGPDNAFVSKLNPTGSGLVYSTYLGGGVQDEAYGIAVDTSGSAYVAGHAGSPNFPTTAGAFQTSKPNGPGGISAFVTKLNPTGSRLVYSTYLGGDAFDGGDGIAVDSSRQAYVAGYAGSNNFPTTAGAFQTSLKGPANAFIVKLNRSGSGLVYSTYLGGSSYDLGNGIALDSSGSAYVTGSTSSSDFPTTAGAFQTTLAGSENAFVAKLNATGSALVFSTYLGGSNYDLGGGIGVDSSGNTYVSGYASSSNFPTTAGAFQTTLAGGQNAFFTTLNGNGSALLYSTYLGGGASDNSNGVAVDSLGNAYVTGATSSSNFPTTAGAFQTSLAGTTNAFVAKFENTSQAQVGNLQSTVENLVSTGTLSAAWGHFLLGPLNAALAAVNAGRAGIAIRDLHGFIGNVRLLVAFGRLTPTEGQTLINAANNLITALGD